MGGLRQNKGRLDSVKKLPYLSQPMFNLTFEVSSWVENKTQRYLLSKKPTAQQECQTALRVGAFALEREILGRDLIPSS